MQELGPTLNRHPIIPRWSVNPRENEHAPLGRPPFDILFLPETPRIVEKSNVFFNQEGQERLTDYPQLEAQITQNIAERRNAIDQRNDERRDRLLAEGKSTEEIQQHMTLFFDGELARLHPKDIMQDKDNILFRLGKTTYFTYAGSRERKNLQYGYDRLGLALAVCSIVTAPSQDGTTKILYTIRGKKNETYPGWFHTIGGTVGTIHNGIANPNLAIQEELIQETGLESKEFKIEGITGVMMNNFDLHPEIIYQTTVTAPVEEWVGKRQTDKEVNLAYFTDTSGNLRDFVLGQLNTEVTDGRPLVPSGLFGYLAYGRMRYGQEWFEQVLDKIPQY